MAAFNLFAPFLASIGNSMDLSTDTLNLALFTAAVAPTGSDGTYSTSTGLLNLSGATEVANGNGYTSGGQALTGNNYSESAGTASLTVSGTPTWTVPAFVSFSFRYVVLYDGTAGTSTARPLIGWWDWGSTLTLQGLQGFSPTFPSNVLTLT